MAGDDVPGHCLPRGIDPLARQSSPSDGVGEKDPCAGDGVERSGVWRKRARTAPKNVGDLRPQLAADIAEMHSADRDEALRWKELYWRAERELNDQTQRCTFLESQLAAKSARKESAMETDKKPVGDAEKIADLEKKSEEAINHWRGVARALVGYLIATVLMMSIGWAVHANHLFNQDEVNKEIEDVVAVQSVTSLQTLATDEFSGFIPVYWNRTIGAIKVALWNDPTTDRWITVNAQDYDDLNDWYGPSKGHGGVVAISAAAQSVLSKRSERRSAQHADPQKSIPISADPPKPEHAQPSDNAKGIETNDAEWKKAAEGPYATQHELKVFRDYIITECRDDLSVALVALKGDKKLLKLKPVLYIAFKLRLQQEREVDPLVSYAASDTSSPKWIIEHGNALNDRRIYAILSQMSAQIPLFGGAEIYATEGNLLGCDDDTHIVHLLDDDFNERFVHVDCYWYEMFKSCLEEHETNISYVCSAFTKKYGYNHAACISESHVEPESVDPTDEVQKKLDERIKALEKLEQQPAPAPKKKPKRGGKPL